MSVETGVQEPEPEPSVLNLIWSLFACSPVVGVCVASHGTNATRLSGHLTKLRRAALATSDGGELRLTEIGAAAGAAGAARSEREGLPS